MEGRQQINALEDPDRMRLPRFLQRDCRFTLQISSEVRRDFTDESLESQLAQEQLRGFLVRANENRTSSAGTAFSLPVLQACSASRRLHDLFASWRCLLRTRHR